MNEDEHILLVKLTNEYWNNFSKLIGQTLSKCPRHLQDELMHMLQDHSSCYGSDYAKYLGMDIPEVESLKDLLVTLTKYEHKS